MNTLFAKKDAYIPALRVSSEFAERAQEACDKLWLHPPKIRRETWEDFIRIAESDQTLMRPVRLLTQELIVELSSATLDDIQKLFPAPAPRRKTPIVALAAASSIAFIAVMFTSSTHRHGIESSVAKVAPVSTPAVIVPAPLAPPPKEQPTADPEIETPKQPSRIAKRSKHKSEESSRQTDTKSEAVAHVSRVWDKKEKAVDKQLAFVDRKIAKTKDDQTKGNLKEWQRYYKQKRDYVRRSRTYHANQTRLAWDKEHGTSMFVDSVRANLGF